MKALACAAILALASAAQAQSFAITKNSPARGARSCQIKQQLKDGIDRQKLYAAVAANGTVGLGIAKDKFPGTSVYFLVAGRRYVGRAGDFTVIDAKGLAALKRDAQVDFAYYDWPYRSEHNAKETIDGFAAAYDKCMAFFKN